MIRFALTLALAAVIGAALGLRQPAPRGRVRPTRDWTRDPAIADLTGVRRVVATSDIHGALPQAVATLTRAGLVAADRGPPGGCGYRWTGGDAVWISTGDFGDRGDDTAGVFRLVDCLTPQAAAAGGRVVPVLGNHDVMLVSGSVARRSYWNRLSASRQAGYRVTIESLTRGGGRLAELVGPWGWVGKMIRRMPVMAVVNGEVGFMHGGLGEVTTRRDLAAAFRRLVERDGWGDPLLTPRRAADVPRSPVWARYWWRDADHVDRLLAGLEISALVFGHTPCGLAADEADCGRILTDPSKRLYNVDVGMCPVYGLSDGGALEIRWTDAGAEYRALYPGEPDQLLTASGPGWPGAAFDDR